MKCFEEIVADMKRHSLPHTNSRVQIGIPDAGQILEKVFAEFLQQQGRSMQWLPEYNEVARWLTNNEGRGLFLFGSCGRGKSMLCRYVLPAILLTCCRKVVSVFDMQQLNANIDLVLQKHIISLDDVGTEDVSNHYGNKRLAFAETVDAAEKYGKLLIVSTNLSVDDIRRQYGDRVLDRIRSTTCRVLFEGESMRK